VPGRLAAGATVIERPPYPPESQPESQQGPQLETEAGGPHMVRMRLPLAKPVVTNILLGMIAVVYLAESVLSLSIMTTSDGALFTLGAQVNSYVAMGQYWRLLAAMFLHIGIMHILFNGWALFVLGREVEAFFGRVRYTLLYFITGLFSGLAFYLLGAPNVLSAGASGAIFGVIGGEVAYFVRNRRVFGTLSQRQLRNLATLVVINLIFGFTIPGINNYAHLGGLVSGFLLGLALSPHYEVQWDPSTFEPKLTNRNPFVAQAAAVTLAVILLAAGIRYGDNMWARRLPGLPSSGTQATINSATTGYVGTYPTPVEIAGPPSAQPVS
jgi:rhomboid protease GluP